MALAALCTTMVFASSAEKQESDDSLSLDGLRKIVQRFASEFQVDPDDEAQQNDPRNFTLQQLAREWMLNSRVEGLRINRSILRIEGAVSGYGLFATRDIEPGELISCYPGDVLMYHPTDGILFGGHVPKSIREVELVDGWLDYSLAEDDDYAVVGIPDLNQDPAYLGHFANDGARLLGVDEGAADDYVAASERARNAQHVDVADGLHMVTLATRHIRRGEEIFVSYGEEYWMEYNSRHHFMVELEEEEDRDSSQPVHDSAYDEL